MRGQRRKSALAVGIICLFAAGCGQRTDQAVLINDAAESTEPVTGETDTSQTDTETVLQETETAMRGNKISEQSFDVDLAPLGKVSFSSYTPVEKQGDVIFAIEQQGTEIAELESMESDDQRKNDQFCAVEAVSFPDYDGDGANDIITICSYQPENGDKFLEARIYKGNTSGQFTLEKELSMETNAALTEMTVDSVKQFIGAVDTANSGSSSKSMEGWQQAYIDHIRTHTADEGQEYDLIYLDADDVPELVEIGNCEAAGCRILNFYNGRIQETQLGRLYFTYIEKENLLCNSEGLMGYYYDNVYSIKDGVLTLIGNGEYWFASEMGDALDENGEPLYEYSWNGTKVSKEEYEQDLRAIYDTDKAKEGYQWDDAYSAEKIIEVLEGMK